MNKEKAIEIIEQIMDVLTFRRVALLTILASFCIVLLAAFENRTALFSSFYKNTAPLGAVAWTLSEESKKQLADLTNTPSIGAVIFSDVDLQKNQRTIKYFYVKDQREFDQMKLLALKLIPQPLFDNDSDNTDQMVSMLNNEFRCVPANKTSITKFVPDFEKKYATVCRIAVPPFFGQFAGYVSIGLYKYEEGTDSKDSLTSNFEALHLKMTQLATDIYVRDLASRN